MGRKLYRVEFTVAGYVYDHNEAAARASAMDVIHDVDWDTIGIHEVQPGEKLMYGWERDSIPYGLEMGDGDIFIHEVWPGGLDAE